MKSEGYPVTQHHLNAAEGTQDAPAPETSLGGSDNTPQALPGTSAATGNIYESSGASHRASEHLPGFVDAGSAGSKY